MVTPRRRLIRPSNDSVQTNQQHQRKVQKIRERLARERAALKRWQTRLKRAFKAVMKAQAIIVRVEKQLTNLEG
jgi:uncharacterized UPF0160 family protein